jgi:hypothetical protein
MLSSFPFYVTSYYIQFVRPYRMSHKSGAICTVVGANLCSRDPLELKDKGIKAVGGIADKEAYTVHTTNIVSQRQYIVARCLSSYVGNVFGLHSVCVSFLLPAASDVGKAHRFDPTTVQPCNQRITG